jgi:hypothetical protein
LKGTCLPTQSLEPIFLPAQLHTNGFQFLLKPYNTQDLLLFSLLISILSFSFFKNLKMIEKNSKRELGNTDNYPSHESN